MGVYNEDKEGLEKFKRELNLAGNSDIPEHLIRRDKDGTVITYMDDTGRILNHGYSEGENFLDYDDQAKWGLKVKGKEWDDEFQKLKNQGKKIGWLYEKMRAQSEMLELSGARIMKVEDNFQRPV